MDERELERAIDQLLTVIKTHQAEPKAASESESKPNTAGDNG